MVRPIAGRQPQQRTEFWSGYSDRLKSKLIKPYFLNGYDNSKTYKDNFLPMVGIQSPICPTSRAILSTPGNSNDLDDCK
jgi:hypothetical protein